MDDLKSNIYMINIISVLVLIISYFLFRKASGSMSLWKLNMLSFIFYVFLFLMCYIGAVLVINHIDNHYLVNMLKTEETRFYGWAAVMYTMIALPIGMLMAKWVFTFRSSAHIFENYRHKKIETLVSFKDSYVRIALYVLSGISIASIVYTVYYTNHVPLVSLFQGLDSDALSKQRIMSGRSFEGNEYFRNIFGVGLTPILAMISLSYYKMTRSAGDRAWFMIMLFFTALILTYDLQKSSFVMFIVGLVMLNVMTQVKVKKGLIAIYVVMCVLLLISAYAALSAGFSAETLLSYNTGIFGRIFLSGIAGLFHSFEQFPGNIPFLGFSTLSTFISDLFSLPYQERSARMIMEAVNPHGVEEGTAGVVNSLFVAEAWANFGFCGVILSPFYVGFLIGLLYYFLIMTKKTPIFLGLYGYFSYKATIMGGFNDYLYNAGVAIMLILMISVIVSAREFYIYRNIQKG